MYESMVVGANNDVPRRRISFDDEGFDDKQCCQEIMETELTAQEYQNRSKRKARRPKPQPPGQLTTSDRDQSLPTSKQRSKLQLLFDMKPRKLTKRNPSQVSTSRKDESPVKSKQIKLPIQYSEEYLDYSMQSKKVVYRGYAPRSSHYYLKTLRELNHAEGSNEPLEIRKDCEVNFNSKFQSGNLSHAMRIGQMEYWLYMREDTNTKGLRQWFYFEVANRRPVRLKFRLYRFSRYFSLYRKGAKPFVLTKRSAQEGGQWQQGGENIKYDYDPEQKCYYLEFEYSFEEENGITYFSSLPPYTYTKMLSYINGLLVNATVTKHTLGVSLSGLEIPYLEIAQHTPEHNQRQFVVVLARTHPGETVSNFALEGFLDMVLHHSKLLAKYIFIVVPMINPDGVFFGNHRTGLLGQDLNRHFDTEEDEFFPQIVSVKNLVKAVRKRGRIRFLFDLHGHSAKRGIFAYAAEEDKTTSRFVYNRIIPKLLQKKFELFEYGDCVFRNSKEKKDTARVHFMLKERITAITFEQSYSLFYDRRLRKIQPIGVRNWINFGRALAESLQDYIDLVAGKEDPIQTLRDFMPEQFVQPEPQPEPEVQQQLETQQPKALKSQNRTVRQGVPSRSSSTTRSPTKTRFPTRNEPIQIMRNIEQAEKQSSNETKTDESDLQLNDQQLQNFKHNIRQYVRPTYHRQSMAIAQKQMQLSQLELYRVRNLRVHYVSRPSVPKIFRIQHSLNLKERERRLESVKLSHFELPSINKRYG